MEEYYECVRDGMQTVQKGIWREKEKRETDLSAVSDSVYAFKINKYVFFEVVMYTWK